jgi:hypothetical protein
MSSILRSIRVLGVVAVFAALAAACGKSITGPEPSHGDQICIWVNGSLICR